MFKKNDYYVKRQYNQLVGVIRNQLCCLGGPIQNTNFNCKETTIHSIKLSMTVTL